jgi:hypothetical protein
MYEAGGQKVMCLIRIEKRPLQVGTYFLGRWFWWFITACPRGLQNSSQVSHGCRILRPF